MKISIRTILLSVCFFLGACASIPEGDKQISAIKARVLVVNTNNNVERYHASYQAFTDSVDLQVEAVDLNADNQPVETLFDVLNHENYDAIYCIGAKALGAISFIDPETPVVYSSVLNWRRFRESLMAYGVASEIAPQAQLTWFKYIFPALKRVGVIYSEPNDALIEEARSIVAKLGLTLIEQRLKPHESLEALSQNLLTEVDALWLISDPAVMSSKSGLNRLFELADTAKKPVLTYKSLFMDMGATLSIEADLATTGRQAAGLLNMILAGHTPKSSIQYPAGSTITLNLDKVAAYGVRLNDNALGSVTHFIEEVTSPISEPD